MGMCRLLWMVAVPILWKSANFSVVIFMQRLCVAQFINEKLSLLEPPAQHDQSTHNACYTKLFLSFCNGGYYLFAVNLHHLQSFVNT